MMQQSSIVMQILFFKNLCRPINPKVQFELIQSSIKLQMKNFLFCMWFLQIQMQTFIIQYFQEVGQVYRNRQTNSAFQIPQYPTIIITNMEEEHEDSNHRHFYIEDSSDDNNPIQMQNQALQEENTHMLEELYYDNMSNGDGSPQDQEYIQYEKKFKKINRKYQKNRHLFRFAYIVQKINERLLIINSNHNVHQRLLRFNQDYNQEYLIRLRSIIDISKQFKKEEVEENDEQDDDQDEEENEEENEEDLESYPKVEKLEEENEEQEQEEEEQQEVELDFNGRVFQDKEQISNFIIQQLEQQLEVCTNPFYLYELFKIIDIITCKESHPYFYNKITANEDLMIKAITKMFEFPYSSTRQLSVYVAKDFICDGRSKIIEFIIQSRFLTGAFQKVDTTKLDNLHHMAVTASYLLKYINENEEGHHYTLHDQDVFTILSIFEEQVGKHNCHDQMIYLLLPFAEYWKQHLTQQFVQLNKARINAFVDKLKPMKFYYLEFVNLILRKIGYFITNNEQLLDQIDLWLQNEQITQMDGLVKLLTHLISYKQRLTPTQWSRVKRFCLVVPAKVNKIIAKQKKVTLFLIDFYENALKNIGQFGQNSQVIKMAAMHCFECYFGWRSKKMKDIIKLTILQQKGAFKEHAKDKEFLEDLQRRMKKRFNKKQLQIIKTTFGLQIKK